MLAISERRRLPGDGGLPLGDLMKPEYCGVPDDAIDGNGAVVVPNKLNVYFLARQLFATKLALFPRREV